MFFYYQLFSILYFSFDVFFGYGLYDLFKLLKMEEGWLQLDNLGVFYNFGFNDMYFFVFGEGSIVYLFFDWLWLRCFDEVIDVCCQDIFIGQ